MSGHTGCIRLRTKNFWWNCNSHNGADSADHRTVQFLFVPFVKQRPAHQATAHLDPSGPDAAPINLFCADAALGRGHRCMSGGGPGASADGRVPSCTATVPQAVGASSSSSSGAPASTSSVSTHQTTVTKAHIFEVQDAVLKGLKFDEAHEAKVTRPPLLVPPQRTHVELRRQGRPWGRRGWSQVAGPHPDHWKPHYEFPRGHK